eukprot:g8795.t1
MTFKKNILITGSSTGIGADLVTSLARSGHTIFATMRKAKTRAEGLKLQKIAKEEGLAIHCINLDVNNEASCKACVNECQRLCNNEIDVLINNAGISASLKGVEEHELDTFRNIMETNYFAPIRLTKLVLPTMRHRKSGIIINVTSAAAKMWPGSQAPYNASKAAFESFSVTLAQEVSQFGIKVCTLQPGVIVTPIFSKGERHKNSIYDVQIRYLSKMYEGVLVKYGTPPKVTSEVVKRIILECDQGTQKMFYPAGPDSIGMSNAIEKNGYNWFVDTSIKMTRSDEAYVQGWKEHYGIDLSAAFPKLKKSNL